MPLVVRWPTTARIRPVEPAGDELLRLAWAMSPADFRVVQLCLRLAGYRGEIAEES